MRSEVWNSSTRLHLKAQFREIKTAVDFANQLSAGYLG